MTDLVKNHVWSFLPGVKNGRFEEQFVGVCV